MQIDSNREIYKFKLYTHIGATHNIAIRYNLNHKRPDDTE